MTGNRSTTYNLQVLYEDNHIIVINKRAGDIVQGDKTGDQPLSDIVKDYIKIKYNKPGNVYLGVTHRLDRPTTGLVIFARTSKALTRLNASFVTKDIQKTYWAVVKNQPQQTQNTITHWLVRNPKQNKSFAYAKEVKNSKKAILSYVILKRLKHYFLLEIDLHTGRHHQIRSQLAAIGCPIKGDLKYGAARSNPDASIHLHARMLRFMHPVQKKMITLIAPLPKDKVWEACS